MNKYTDNGLNDEWILDKVQGKNMRQVQKWGIQTHTAFEWLTYTTEELGELAEAISEYEYNGAPKKNVVEEAIQVATLALKIARVFSNGYE